MSVNRRRGSTGVSYQCRWRDASGAQRAMTFPRKADAVEWDAKMKIGKKRGGLGPDPGRVTIDDLLLEWFRLHVNVNLRPLTQDSYAGAYDRHIGPYIGGVKLRDFGVFEAAEFLVALSKRTGAPMVKKVLAVLSGMLTHAVRWRMIDMNPIPLLQTPRQNTDREALALSPREVESLCSWFRSHGREQDPFMVNTLAYSGLRPGELRALTWGDIRDSHILVRRAIAKDIIGKTKTGKTRRVDLMKPLKEDLLRLRLLEGSPSEDAFVFSRPDKTFIRDEDWKNWQSRWFRRATNDLGIATTRPYDLRHSFASLHLQAGLPPLQVAAQMGHGPDVLYKHYAHIIEDFRGVAAIDPEREIRIARGEGVPELFPWGAVPVVAVGANMAIGLEPTSGFEPLTPSLRVKCSTS